MPPFLVKTSFCVFFSFAIFASQATTIDSLQNLLQIEVRQSNHQRQIELLTEIGKTHADNNDFVHSISFFEEGISIAKKTKNKNHHLKLLTEKGKVLLLMGNFSGAVDNWVKVVEEIKSTKEGDLAQAYGRLAEAYQGLGNNELAYEYHLSSLQLHEDTGDSLNMARSLYNIGCIFFYQDNYELALEHYGKALEICEANNSKQHTFSSLCAIGGTYNRLGDIEKSLEYNIRAIELGKETGNKTGLAYATMNNGANYAALKDYDKALEQYEIALAINQEMNDTWGECNTLRITGEAYMNKGEFKKSLEYLNKALQKSEQMGSRPMLLELNRSFASYYERIKDYKQAATYFKNYASLKDSLSNEATLQKMSNSKSRYEVLQKERALALKEVELANQQKSFLLFGVGILSICLWLLFRQNKFKTKNNRVLAEKNAKIQAQNQQLEQSNIELKRFAYIASHDLKEPLRTIGSYANLLQRRYKNKIDPDANEFLEFITSSANRLYTLLNDVMHFSKLEIEHKELSLTDANEAMKIANQNLREKIMEKNAKISSGNLPKITANQLHLVQLFQNLIDNSIKYSDKASPTVEIASHEKNGFYEFSIKDNGIGIEPDYQQNIFEMFKRLHTKDKYEGSGIGLSICKKIVQQYGGDIWVNSSEGEGCTFFFTFPIPAPS